MTDIRAGIYKHHRGGLYQVLGVAQHTETNEWLVIYISLTGAHLPGPRMRARPLNGPDGWDTEVEVKVNYEAGNPPIEQCTMARVPRFQYIGLEISQ